MALRIKVYAKLSIMSIIQRKRKDASENQEIPLCSQNLCLFIILMGLTYLMLNQSKKRCRIFGEHPQHLSIRLHFQQVPQKDIYPWSLHVIFIKIDAHRSPLAALPGILVATSSDQRKDLIQLLHQKTIIRAAGSKTICRGPCPRSFHSSFRKILFCDKICPGNNFLTLADDHGQSQSQGQAIRDAMVSQKEKKLLIFCLSLTERDSSLKRLHNRGSVLFPNLPLLSHQPGTAIVGISGPHRRGNLFVSPSLIGELQWGVHYICIVVGLIIGLKKVWVGVLALNITFFHLPLSTHSLNALQKQPEIHPHLCDSAPLRPKHVYNSKKLSTSLFQFL
ncbi:unnamed protein product [Lactuca saligna]|uniref:Uncharacterized protein n=1 Tax=Lactuca saligna TaxID=75948 RepID=A0AA35Z8M6_LACSI|nr:unnamed protein product [Lactuca saligna]